MTIENEATYQDALTEYDYLVRRADATRDTLARLAELEDALTEWETKGKYECK